jgi:alpha-galactosidase
MKDTGVDDEGHAEVPPLAASHEYASLIIEARLRNGTFAFNGNVMNRGAITNLPHYCCVEVPCVADAEGVRATHVGALPTQCAALNRTNVNVQELAVEAALRRDREAAFHACALDPLTAAVVPLPKIRAMFEELWAAEGDRLAYFDA